MRSPKPLPKVQMKDESQLRLFGLTRADDGVTGKNLQLYGYTPSEMLPPPARPA